ncbi:hypothetical protein PFDG_01785 [Plasmodium falciparum Dd2]|uniref:Coronin n=1 Tax=Plasmodium falciparum (isolate Dd2) TaxID=57267 RepID=A0A0L7LZY8_PLAF4|nr:hypothetical protein PFDG_01785 [Plasmodium falciparum Dd2]
MYNVPLIKNLYPDPSNNLYGDLRICSRATETCGIACSAGYIAVPWQVEGGGMIGVIRLENQVRNPPVIKLKSHTSPILDLSFNPCYSEILASCSEDMSIRIWEIRHEDENVNEVKDPLCILNGHKKKVNILSWNPMNYFILSSTSFDSSVNIWDIENEKKAFEINMPKKLSSLQWDIGGNLLSGTCQNKQIHIIDPRKQEICNSFLIHDGGKSTKCIWIDGFGGEDKCILTTGFSKNNMRELKLWSLKNTTSPLTTITLDNAASPLLPHYDESVGMIYLIGKGDGNCRYYQYSQGSIRKVDEYKSCLPFRSFGFLPKRMCDVYKCEIGRVYKNENNTDIRPISFYVPRKNSSIFQEDLYPPIIMRDPERSTNKWIDGINLDIKRVSIKDLTEDDLLITKKFKQLPKESKSILIQDNNNPKKGSIMRQFTKKFTFRKKKETTEIQGEIMGETKSSIEADFEPQECKENKKGNKLNEAPKFLFACEDVEICHLKDNVDDDDYLIVNGTNEPYEETVIKTNENENYKENNDSSIQSIRSNSKSIEKNDDDNNNNNNDNTLQSEENEEHLKHISSIHEENNFKNFFKNVLDNILDMKMCKSTATVL